MRDNTEEEKVKVGFKQYAEALEEKITREAYTLGARWWLLTDGSGTHHLADGDKGGGDPRTVPGASSWVIWDADKQVYHVGSVGFTSSSVDRAEMHAALGGLEFIQDVENIKINPGDGSVSSTCRVVWIGDRESLLRAAMWKDDKTGTLYRRLSNKHLWSQYEWFERRFTVFPIRRNRNTVKAQKLCDALCGQMRVLIRSWFFGPDTIKTISDHLDLAPAEEKPAP